MKQSILLFATVLISSSFFGQETPQQQNPTTEFTITKNQGLTDFIITTCEGKTKEELYKKTIEWINKNYANPKEVIKAQAENDYIRFQGISKDEYCFYNLLTVYKDIKYQIDVLGLSNSYKKSYGITSWSEVKKIANSWTYFKNNGEVRKMYRKTLPKISGYFNNLNKNLYLFYMMYHFGRFDNWHIDCKLLKSI